MGYYADGAHHGKVDGLVPELTQLAQRRLQCCRFFRFFTPALASRAAVAAAVMLCLCLRLSLRALVAAAYPGLLVWDARACLRGGACVLGCEGADGCTSASVRR